MPATEYQGTFLGRSILSIRRNQVVAMDGSHEQELEDLEIFQRHVGDRFSELLSSTETTTDGVPATDTLLSISWLRKLLDIFLCCEAEFKAILFTGRDPTQMAKPPFDRFINEFLERAIKALDVCNAITLGVDWIRHCQSLGQIAVLALEQRPLGDGQVRRARKALNALISALSMDDKENNAGKSTERAWSFGRRGGASGAGTGTGSASVSKDQSIGNLRSASLSMSKTFSAAKQIQAMMSNLVAPRGAETSGLASPIYIMSSILVFVIWSLAAAIPCQERNGLTTHFPVARSLNWAQAMIGLQEKVADDWKKKERKGSVGLLEEIQRMEKLAQSLIEFADSFQFPADPTDEVVAHVAELAEICRRMEEGLVPLQRQIREIFHTLVRSRSDILIVLHQTTKSSSFATP